MIPESFSFFGLTFHLYGLVVGGAAAAGVFLVERKVIQTKLLSLTSYWTTVAAAAPMALIFGRLWHVLTDWYLYQYHPWKAVAVWEGGMSILGAVLGGIIGITLLSFFTSKEKKISLSLIGDLSIFGLPVAQCLGRLGNYLNQELYGLPSNLAWAIPIEPHHRVAGYEQFTHFHPLFFYEMLATGGFALWLYTKGGFMHKTLGSGTLFLCYIGYYSVVRFFLDFLRVAESDFLLGLGKNQVVLLGVIILVGYQLWHRRKQFLLK